MSYKKIVTLASLLTLLSSSLQVTTLYAQSDPPPTEGTGTRQLVRGGQGVLRPGRGGQIISPQAKLKLIQKEAREEGITDKAESKPHHRVAPVPPAVNSSAVSNDVAGVTVNVEGLNAYEDSFATGFVAEPPDQALCAGNGYVLEGVNTTMRVYDSSGNPLMDTVDANAFYGYAPYFDFTTAEFGPFLTDPVCYYDSATQRWFFVVLTLALTPDGNFTGKNYLDLAVSTTASPLDPWQIYRLPVHDDGTDGTPDHGCSLNPDGSGHGPCIGDYPHIGADMYGIYLTTNEYDFFGPNFKSAVIYAISKKDLVAGAPNPATVEFADLKISDTPGFTVWPAIAPNGQFNVDYGGTEFFLSSMAAEEANNQLGYDNRIGVWSLNNTVTLDKSKPRLRLSRKTVKVNTYGVPPRADQKPGSLPLADCVNDTAFETPVGAGCWRYLLLNEPAHDETLSPLDGNDSRMQQVTYLNHQVWGALNTIVNVNGENRVGVAWYLIQPVVSNDGDKRDGRITGAWVVNQGNIAVANNNFLYPAIGLQSNGKGVIVGTLVGQDYHPSAAFATLDANGTGDLHIVAAGAGPQDGFSGYKAFAGPDAEPRPRWGDYSATAVDGDTIWMASEYIAQTCTFEAYTATPFGTCGSTRDAFANWSTRVTAYRP